MSRQIVIIGQGRRPSTTLAQAQKIKVWRCNNCGHWEPQTESLAELAFKWLAPLTSKVSCPNCGSYTLNRAYDETFYRGEFLIVKTHNKVRGKDRKWIPK